MAKKQSGRCYRCAKGTLFAQYLTATCRMIEVLQLAICLTGATCRPKWSNTEWRWIGPNIQGAAIGNTNNRKYVAFFGVWTRAKKGGFLHPLEPSVHHLT